MNKKSLFVLVQLLFLQAVPIFSDTSTTKENAATQEDVVTQEDAAVVPTFPLEILEGRKDEAVKSVEIIDEIRAIIYYDEGSDIILASDIKPRLDGSKRNLRDLVIEGLQINDARRLKLSVTEKNVEAFLAALQERSGVSRQYLMLMMEAQGYTYEQGKEQVRRNNLVAQIVNIRVGSDKNLIIDREKVEKYYKDNPLFKEATFTLSQAFIPDETDSDKKFSQAELDKLDWEEPFMIVESQLDEKKRFIIDSVVGSIVDEEVVGGGLELTRLTLKTERQPIPLDQRYDKIAADLSSTIFEALKKEYEKQLLDKASIRFTYLEDQVTVMKK